MINEYFTFRMICVYIMLGIATASTIFCAAKEIIDTIKWNRKIKLLTRSGFERYLHDVPSVGGGALYGWRQSGYNRVLELEMKRMSYKELKDTIEKQREV